MIRTIKLKLDVSEQDKESIIKTMIGYTDVFNSCSEWGFSNHTSNKIDCHKATYRMLREKLPNFPAALIQSARDCACETLKRKNLKNAPHRRYLSQIRYNNNSIKVYLMSGTTSISTVDGRINPTFKVPSYYRRYFIWYIKTTHILQQRNTGDFYLYCQIEKETPETKSPENVLGIDRGIINIAVCSNNKFFNSKNTNRIRSKYTHLERELQSKDTRSAKRKLKKLSGRVRRFTADTNHCISKQIVASNSNVFALEDLTNIRDRKGIKKELRTNLHKWSFAQLYRFINYKSENVGKQVIQVDARYTSQKCSVCGHIYKGNRNGHQFKCRKCGFQLHADLNAARNIALAGISSLGRLPVNQPNVTCI